MRCRCCGHPTAPRSGAWTRIVRWFQVGVREQYVADGEMAVTGGTLVAEILCWRCFTWSDTSSPVFGKLYATR